MGERERRRLSELRLKLQHQQQALSAILQRVQGGVPMIRGSLYQRRRLCGKPGCRCVRGELHQDTVLAVRRSGRVVVRKLWPAEDAATQEAALAWRAFQEDRRALSRMCQVLVATVGRLGRVRELKSFCRS